MTKRLAITLAVSLFLAVNAVADVQKAPACQRVLTAEARERVSEAVEDPATTFAKAHSTTAKIPLAVRCASKLWQQQNGVGVLARDMQAVQRAPHITPE